MTEPTPALPALPADAGLAALPQKVLTERLCQLEATLSAGAAVGLVLRGALQARMVEYWRREHVAPTNRALGLGTVTLPIPAEKVAVADEEAFASWLAERHPTEVDAVITLTLPAAELPGVLEVIEAELLTPELLEALGGPDPDDATPDELAAIVLARALRDRKVEVRPKPQFTKLLLEKLVTVMPGGVDEKGEAYSPAVFDDAGEVVAGVKVIPGADPTALDDDGRPVGPQPGSISVRLEAEAKARAAAAASTQFAALLAGAPGEVLPLPEVAAGNQPGAVRVLGPGDDPTDPAVGTWLEGPPEEALAEPAYDDEEEGIAPDAPAVDVLGLSAWRAMRKPELQAECRRLELDDAGTVKDLRGRLADWAASTAGMPA